MGRDRAGSGRVLAALAVLWVGTAYGQTHRVYAHLLEPREHPDDARRAVQPPDWDTFGRQTQFVSLRGFAVKNEAIVGFAEELDKYTVTFDLGRVVWPSYPIVFAKNLDELAAEIKRRDLFLFDIWGYVPGSGPGDYWQQYRPSPEALATLETTLGDHWLGMDVGEQDGRYIGGYAGQMHPISEDRFTQYLNFQRHFERMGNDLGNRLSTLVSLNFGHYFLKEGTYTTIGAETAQALPNSQVYYAFIRGAGKQYGVPWFGNASVFNRWGYKSYGGDGPDHSATKGSSLNLLKRLLYSHILYNSVFVGFESGWFEGGELSPLGRIQQAAQRWVREQGTPGVMLTPVALLFDFYAGWTFPRHLYTGSTYRVWGNIPYGPGDYLADGALDLLYPGYQNSSYYHDEAGFMSPTPYGDIADCLLSDAEGWLLERYPLVVAVSALSGGPEMREKLETYVTGGGRLMITAGNLVKFDEGLCGVKADPTPSVSDTPVVTIDAAEITETAPLTLHRLEYPAGAQVLAQCGERAAAIELPFGTGRLTVLASPFGVPEEPIVRGAIDNPVDAPLPNPYPLLNHVRALLDRTLREQALFTAGEGLSLITCRRAPGRYVLGISNNALKPASFTITSNAGPIESITELPLDQSEKGAVGYLPEGFDKAEVGESDKDVIAGGDVRVFQVDVREEGVEEIPHRAPPSRPRGSILPLGGERTIREEILARPSFFEHFDSVAVDWRYLYDRDHRALKEEAAWIQRQRLRVYVDLTSGINLYPDLRLINNDPQAYAESMDVIDDLLAKMESAGARDLLLTPNRQPENSFTWEQTVNSLVDTLREVCAKAGARSITVYLRVSNKLHAGLNENVQWLERVGAPNLFLAPSLALVTHQQADPASLPEEARQRIGLWLLSASACEPEGVLWTANAPACGLTDRETVQKWLALAPAKPVWLDVPYADPGQEYADSQFLREVRPAGTAAAK